MAMPQPPTHASRHTSRSLRLLCTLALTPVLAATLVACGGSDDVTENACLQVSPTGQVYNPGTPGENGAPEIPTGFATKQTAFARSVSVLTARIGWFGASAAAERGCWCHSGSEGNCSTKRDRCAHRRLSAAQNRSDRQERSASSLTWRATTRCRRRFVEVDFVRQAAALRERQRRRRRRRRSERRRCRARVDGDAARAHGHLERSRSNMILVGRGTLDADAPRLDVRLPGLETRSPARALLSKGQAPEGWLSLSKPEQIGGLSHVQYLMIEGGAQAASAFLKAGLVDRLMLYRAPIVIGAGKGCLSDIGLGTLADAHEQWRLVDERPLGKDHLQVYERA